MLMFGKPDTITKNPTSAVLADLQSRVDQRDLDHSIKDLTSAEKAHDKSVKAAFDAHRAVDKAIENEYETAKALNRATHNHDVAISNEQNARITAKINQQYEVHLQQGLAEKGVRLGELQQRKAHNDHMRESTVSQDHTIVADAYVLQPSPDNSDRRDLMDDGASGLETGAPGGAEKAAAV